MFAFKDLDDLIESIQQMAARDATERATAQRLKDKQHLQGRISAFTDALEMLGDYRDGIRSGEQP